MKISYLTTGATQMPSTNKKKKWSLSPNSFTNLQFGQVLLSLAYETQENYHPSVTDTSRQNQQVP